MYRTKYSWYITGFMYIMVHCHGQYPTFRILYLNKVGSIILWYIKGGQCIYNHMSFIRNNEIRDVHLYGVQGICALKDMCVFDPIQAWLLYYHIRRRRKFGCYKFIINVVFRIICTDLYFTVRGYAVRCLGPQYHLYNKTGFVFFLFRMHYITI